MNRLIDFDYAINLLGGDRLLALEILADFKREIPQYLKTLNEHLDRKDYAQLISTIHKVGGGASYAGALSIREIAKKIELTYKNEAHFREEEYRSFLQLLETIHKMDIDDIL